MSFSADDRATRPLAQVKDGIDHLPAWIHRLGDGALGEPLIEIREAIDRLEAVFADGLRRFDRSGEYKTDGALSAVAWLRWKCKLSGGAAAERVEIARTDLRRKLEARDDGCVFEGCDRRQSWTDAHHLIHWADGGPTTLENLGSLCRPHHTRVHEEGWRLERRKDGGFTAIPPPWRVVGRARSVRL